MVGLSRGSLVPAVIVSHLLGLRNLRAVSVARTRSDKVSSAKLPAPVTAKPITCFARSARWRVPGSRLRAFIIHTRLRPLGQFDLRVRVRLTATAPRSVAES
jgi:hypothetical protein